MIDCAEIVIPGKSSSGYKYFKEDEWFFEVHWKNDPNVPRDVTNRSSYSNGFIVYFNY